VAHLIPKQAIDKYSAAPSSTTITAARRLQEKIRDLLGSNYETFLQGSYKNTTAAGDIDDVDIVALQNGIVSGTFGSSLPGRTIVTWESIFSVIERQLATNSDLRGRISRGDKCVKVSGDLAADIVPAIRITAPEDDPVAIYSWREGSERKNYPRVHYANNVDKHERTVQRYKPTVRMIKHWARNWFGDHSAVAPSFYLECLLYNVPDILFCPDEALRFSLIISHLVGLSYVTSRVLTVAGDKDILLPGEWGILNFSHFQSRLSQSRTYVSAALTATSQEAAINNWRRAFND